MFDDCRVIQLSVQSPYWRHVIQQSVLPHFTQIFGQKYTLWEMVDDCRVIQLSVQPTSWRHVIQQSVLSHFRKSLVQNRPCGKCFIVVGVGENSLCRIQI